MFRDNNARHVSTSFSRIFPLFHNSNRTGPDENSFNGSARKEKNVSRDAFQKPSTVFRPWLSADVSRARADRKILSGENFLSLKFDHFCRQAGEFSREYFHPRVGVSQFRETWVIKLAFITSDEFLRGGFGWNCLKLSLIARIEWIKKKEIW